MRKRTLPTNDLKDFTHNTTTILVYYIYIYIY